MLTQILFSGLAIGSIYGPSRLGFAVIFKATEVFNFAQGMLVVVGAYSRGAVHRADAAAVCAGRGVHPPQPPCSAW
jgi:branched-chain amino acid transport system permease protein